MKQWIRKELLLNATAQMLRKFSSVTRSTMSSLISTSQLKSILSNVTILDASWYLPSTGRNGYEEYKQQRIPGAQFFDINGSGLSDKTTSLPHMLPSTTEFAQAAASLGITKTKPVVVYDSAGLFSAARVWYHLRTFGHKNVSVLDGGFPQWIDDGYEIETGPLLSSKIEVEEWLVNKESVRSFNQICDTISIRKENRNVEDLRANEIIVDARGSGRFTGQDIEIRPGIKSGHIPGSLNVPYTLVLDSSRKNRCLLSKVDLQKVFQELGVDLKRTGKIITSCGSGVTAAVITLALTEAGRPFESAALYDGSWTEYGGLTTSEIALGNVNVYDLGK